MTDMSKFSELKEIILVCEKLIFYGTYDRTWFCSNSVS